MAHFESMSEFRQALQGLVNPSQPSRAGRQPAQPTRAGRQPAQYLWQDEDIFAPVVEQRPKPKKKGGRLYRNIYAKIAVSVGGSKVLCPTVDWSIIKARAKQAGVGAYEFMLREAGVTPKRAEAIVRAMERADVLTHGSGSRYDKGPEAKATARKILLKAGIACPMLVADMNPRSRRGRRGRRR